VKAERYARIRAVLDQRQPDLTVLMENVHKPHNLSAILRSCDAVGVFTAHAVTLDGKVPTYSETSASADKWLPLQLHQNIDIAFANIRQQGFKIVATHLSDQSRDYQDWDYSQPTCILLGAERWGVSETAAAAADANIIIPMRGMVQSLNVSVAAAVVLFEAARQKAAKGHYNAPRLGPEQYRQTAFEWLYPNESAHFREHGLPYPALDDEGGMVRKS
jgi:tRNA (guanosine-2'-O-)-methyltransferase